MTPARTDKVYLVGFMGSGKTTVARALGRRLGWRVHRPGRGDRTARRADGLAGLRRRRASPTSGRSSGRSCSRSCPLRNVIVATGGGTFIQPANRADILADGTDGLARRALQPDRRSGAIRRSATAGGRPRGVRGAVRGTPRRLPVGAPPDRRAGAGRRPRRAPPPQTRAGRRSGRPFSALIEPQRALPRHQRHPRQPSGPGRGPPRLPAGDATTACWCSATSSATAPNPGR